MRVKIYTKTGDSGETGLFGGGRVPKDHLRVRAYGEVDELNAALGFAATLEPVPFESSLLQAIQRDLFTMGAELASKDPGKLREVLEAADVGALEKVIDRYEAGLTPLKNFILPGGAPKAAALHVARTVCRRAERRVVELGNETEIPPLVVIYLNRLSDLLFTLARVANKRSRTGEVTW